VRDIEDDEGGIDEDAGREEWATAAAAARDAAMEAEAKARDAEERAKDAAAAVGWDTDDIGRR